MKRIVNASSDTKIKTLVVDDVPDISNRLIEADVLFAWLDKLVEVKGNAENICDN